MSEQGRPDLEFLVGWSDNLRQASLHGYRRHPDSALVGYGVLGPGLLPERDQQPEAGVEWSGGQDRGAAIQGKTGWQ